MAKIHMFLQGKGGVGKSFAATLLAQQMIEDGKRPLCIDIDPINPTFYGYKALDVKPFDVMEGDDVNPWKFDKMIELVAASDNDVIIDNGASSFIPLVSYFKKTNIPELLQEEGHTLVIHTLIVGGNALQDTVAGLIKTISVFSEETKFVVWLNPVDGPIEEKGKNFYEFKAYTNNAHRISAVIEIPEFQQQTFERNLREMMTANLTFQEALQKAAGLPIVTRQRLTMMRRDIYHRFGQIAEIA
ncbi:MAG: AAA family ATPase [bacterium]|nr:AAA family ATPase [bacterium]